MARKAGFAKRVGRIISGADIIIEVLDARFPELTRNPAMERRVLSLGKRLILLLNKSDLISGRTAKSHSSALSKTAQCIFLSTKQRRGGSKLRKAIGSAAKGKKVLVGIIGYPNTGKSSVINLLRGRHVAPTAPSAGFTKGEQRIRLGEKISLIDSPGVVPLEVRDECELALICAKSPNQISDVEGCAEFIIRFVRSKNPSALENAYGLPAGTEESELLARIAVARNRLKKGGEPDTYTAARMLIADWQQGKIKV